MLGELSTRFANVSLEGGDPASAVNPMTCNGAIAGSLSADPTESSDTLA